MHRSLLLCIALLSWAVGTIDPSAPLFHRQLPEGSSIAQPGNATFDFVIVGGGTAGLTIASRLAENHALSVAVIEAGGFYEVDSGNISVVPGYSTFYAGTDPNDTDPRIDWNFVTTPQAASFSSRRVAPCYKLIRYRAQLTGSCTMHVGRPWEAHLRETFCSIIGKSIETIVVTRTLFIVT